MNHEKKELYTKKLSSGLDVSDPLIAETLNKVKTEVINWFLIGFKDASVLEVKCSGSGGAAEMLGNLKDSEILFGVIKASINGMIKFYQLSFIGKDVSPLKKGKSAMYKNAAMNSFEGCHGEITLDSDDLTIKSIVDTVMKLNRLNDSSTSIII